LGALSAVPPPSVRGVVVESSSLHAARTRTRTEIRGNVVRRIGVHRLLSLSVESGWFKGCGEAYRQRCIVATNRLGWRERLRAEDPGALVRFGAAILSRGSVLGQLGTAALVPFLTASKPT
jgi:hypothetical protein